MTDLIAPDKEAQILLELVEVRASYGTATALFDVSLALPTGASLALLGPNGAGKSTIARCISGLVGIDGGSIELGGTTISGKRAHHIRRLGVSYVPEGRGIFPGLTVAENLKMAVRWLDGRRTKAEAVERACELFPVLGQRSRQAAGNLSGGEQQMLSVAGGLAVSPRLLILDELSLGLAPMVVDALFEGLGTAVKGGTTVLLIEQYIHRALEFCDECAILRKGSIQWSGPSSEAGDEVLRRYLGDSMDEQLVETGE
jgi:branched-chain amino acid transport system ATP-binding protein